MVNPLIGHGYVQMRAIPDLQLPPFFSWRAAHEEAPPIEERQLPPDSIEGLICQLKFLGRLMTPSDRLLSEFMDESRKGGWKRCGAAA